MQQNETLLNELYENVLLVHFDFHLLPQYLEYLCLR